MEGVEITELLDFIGVNDVKNLDEFKEKFNTGFVTREAAIKDPDIRNTIHGQMFGGMTTAIKRQLKEGFGVELGKEEVEGKKYEDILALGVSKAKEGYETKINTLSEQVKSSPKAEEIEAEWKGKYEKVLGEKSNFENLLETTNKEFEEFKTNIATKEKTSAIDSKVNSLLSGLEFSEQVNDLTKVGFLKTMESSYALDLSETGELQIKKDGNLIPDPNKHGAFMSPSDIYKSEAEKNKLLKAPNAKSSTFVKPTINNDGLPANNRPNRATADQAF